MNAVEFLQAVWPAKGPYCIARGPFPRAKGGAYFKHNGFETITEAAAFALHSSVDNVFFAVHVLKGLVEETAADGRTYLKVRRTDTNMRGTRAFHGDLDCGEGKPYADRREAAVSLHRFIQITELPWPLMVSSGRGLHVYWLLQTEMESQEWKRFALTLKALAAHHGLHLDPAATSDTARVLRVPGTFHRKDPTNPVKVKVLPGPGGQPAAHTPNALFLEILNKAAKVLAEPEVAEAVRVFGELPMPIDVAKACPTFVRMVKDAPTASEPLWWTTLQIVRHTSGGDKLGHRLSKVHLDYTFEETQEKLDRLATLRTGPPTCNTLQGLYATDSPCPTCPNYGRPSSSPIVFARAGATHPKTTILIEGGGNTAAVDAAMASLLAAGAPVYSRGGTLVRPIEEEVEASKGRTTTAARLKAWTVASLSDLLGRIVRFERYDARVKKRLSIDPPTRVAEAILAREELWKFPKIVGCVTTPTLRPDGSLLSESGFDPATQLYHVLDPGLSLPAMPEAPTREDAEAALSLLTELLSGFPFVAGVDRAVALSTLMTPVLRGGMTTAPLHLIRAHTAGTGKSYLGDLAATIATGRIAPAVSVGKTEEELEKRLGAMLLAGSPIVSLDNANGEVGGDMLCHATERRAVSIRPLGVSEAREVECRATVFCNGNNTTVTGDMVRRTITCNLDAEVERPELRRFSFDPITRVLAHRGDYIAAVLTIARAYRTASCPKVCGPLGSYGDWTVAVRAPLMWLGEADPSASMEEARAQDPVLTAARELFSHWEASVDLRPGVFYRANQIADAAGKDTDFDDLVIRQAGVGGKVSTKALGRFLARIHGRIVDGWRLDMRADIKHGHTFAMVKAKPG